MNLDDVPYKERLSVDGNVPDAIAEAIDNGQQTPEEIANELNVDIGKLTPILNRLVDINFLTVSNEDGRIRYFTSDTDMDVSLASEDNAKARSGMSVNRDYSFEDRVPEGVPEFYQTDGEKDQILADLRANRQIAEMQGRDKARLPRYWVTGPTGAGKTHLSRKVAEEEEAALFTIQGRYSMNEADLLGSPLLVDGETVWVDGPLTKALLASRQMPVVLLIDEANRARPESKSVLFSVLDDRCQVELDALGGEVVRGNPMNLISFATINQGPGYQTQKLDLAEMRRFGLLFEMNHLGMEHPKQEAELIVERSMIGETVATAMVDAAQYLRTEAGDDGSPPGEIQRGVPTALLINWAQVAYAYEQENISNPVVKAAEAAVVRPFYNDDNPQWVRDHLLDEFDTAPVADFNSWTDKEMDDFVS